MIQFSPIGEINHLSLNPFTCCIKLENSFFVDARGQDVV